MNDAAFISDTTLINDTSIRSDANLVNLYFECVFINMILGQQALIFSKEKYVLGQ